MQSCSVAQHKPQPSKLFTPPQQQALRSWNAILMSINVSCASDNYLSPQLIADNRLAAFQLFRPRHAGDGGVALSALAGALKTVKGHWVNGEPPAQSIPAIIAHMNESLLYPMSGLERYRSSFAKLQGTALPARREYGILEEARYAV